MENTHTHTHRARNWQCTHKKEKKKRARLDIHILASDIVEPNSTGPTSESLHLPASAVSELATRDECRCVCEPVVAHGTPSPVMRDLQTTAAVAAGYKSQPVFLVSTTVWAQARFTYNRGVCFVGEMYFSIKSEGEERE